MSKKRKIFESAKLKLLQGAKVSFSAIICFANFSLNFYFVVSFQIDVCYVPKIQGFCYALVVVDQYSNFLYVKPLKKKSAESVRKALDEIIEENKLFKARQ